MHGKRESFTLVELLVSIVIIVSLITFSFLFLDMYRQLAINQQDTTHANLLADSAYEYLVYERNEIYRNCQEERESQKEQWPSACGAVCVGGTSRYTPTNWLTKLGECKNDDGCHIDEENSTVSPFSNQTINGFIRKIKIGEHPIDKCVDTNDTEWADVTIIVKKGESDTEVVREYHLYNWYF